MRAIPVTPRVWSVPIPFAVPLPGGQALPRRVDAWLCLGDRVLLVDAGVAGADEAILNALAELGQPASAVACLILTHSHPDHLGAATAIRARTHCRVLAHSAERAWIEDTQLQQRQRPVPGFERLVAGPVPIDETLRDGQTLDWPGLGPIQVLHTPGHSPGSLSLFLPAEGLLLTGDAVPPPGAMPIYTDLLASAHSLRRLLSLEGVTAMASSWDETRRGPAVATALRASLRWLQTVHAEVRQASAADPAVPPMALCERVVNRLGLHPSAANPLVAASLEAHRRVLPEPAVADLLDPEA